MFWCWPGTAGIWPPQMKMTSSPMLAMFFCWPERKPSPRPTSISREPTPQAMPNMVRNERSLCAHRVRITWAKMSKAILIAALNTLDQLLWFQSVRQRGAAFVTWGKAVNLQGNRQFESIKQPANSGGRDCTGEPDLRKSRQKLGL